MKKIPTGTKIEFVETIEEEATGEHPYMLLAKKGETGYIVDHLGKFGYSVVVGVLENNTDLFSAYETEFKVCD